MRLGRLSFFGVVLAMILASDAAPAEAPGQVSAKLAAFTAASPRCVPAHFNRSSLLPGTSVAVAPLPDSYDASWRTQISMVGAPASAIHGVHVSGSRSGSHGGHLRGYSQGDGASFVPSRPFSPGETVSVRGRVSAAGHARSFAYHFVVAHEDHEISAASASGSSRNNYRQMQHFHSAPSLLAPSIVVSARAPQASQQDILATPYAGAGPSGPMILDAAGNLVWFHPLPSGTQATNLQVQQLGSTPVLTWWQGSIVMQGFGQGEEVIESASYNQIGRVHAGNGLKADLHDFRLTARGTGLMTVFNPIACDLSAYGGQSGASVTDGVVQEVDLKTGLVRREWHSLDHVSPSDSYSSPARSDGRWPFDYFHVNSIAELANGRTLISARNTSALYELNATTGQVVRRIGGKRSTVRLGGGAATAYQHDARVLANGTISVFDNGGVPKVHSQSRGLILSVDAQHRTDTVVAQFEHSSSLFAGSQGSMQVLDGGNVFLGWGAKPYFTEFSAQGKLLFDAHMHGTYQSYRAYRAAWAGQPRDAPAIAASAGLGK
ncbi:MAG TPA: arylsulfotransferase family protein, partial [Solirubrobacteraceae bacterium]|nr:arylsulfotransferase family protein [Solirubrobacteraceae bacterium]